MARCEKCGWDDLGTGDMSHYCGRYPQKPHYTLRTHDGVPVPPSWATGCELLFRDGDSHRVPRLLYKDARYWPINGTDSDIIAYRWTK